MKSDIDPESREYSCKARKFSVIEENAIYYDPGYVVQKLIGASPTLAVVDGRSTVT